MATDLTHGPGLEAETDDHLDSEGSDSALGTSIVSSTTSITSSIMKHREENGRTYHAYKDGKYLFPNDEGENDRLDLQHHLFSLTYQGKLLAAPVDPSFKIHRLLDVGTGTGIWAIDYADEHPETKVLGVDLSPIQPQFTPPNLSFEIDDLEEQWTFHEKFDFIHSRMMTGSFANWPKFFDQAFENLNPGGYLELSDTVFPLHCSDDSVPADSALKQWSQLGFDAAAKINRNIDSAKTYKAEMERVGFTDVVETVRIWPMNRWPKDKKYKELGLWVCENLSTGISGLSMALFTRVLGMKSEEVEALLIPVRKELRDTRLHGYWPLYTVYGRKPV